MRMPMPDMGFGDRLLFRTTTLLGRRHIAAIYGLEHIQPERDPFIMAINHSSRREAIFLPTLLFIHRGGKRIHFIADWNFALFPPIGLLYWRGQTITIVQKPARPAFLNVLQPLFDNKVPVFERARAHLAAGEPVGIFPEGTVNPDPDKLLRGKVGTAQLSLETGVPVVPVGISFPGYRPDRGQKLPPMEVRIGAPLKPVKSEGPSSARRAYEWHVTIMNEIGRLSGKAWGSR
jgi:1-acyl-sn-glycerol-3-phosphate acyltransferase